MDTLKNRPKVLQQTLAAKKVGRRPGFLYVPSGALKPRLFLLSFDKDFFEDNEFQTYDELLAFYQLHPHARHWIDVRGYADLDLLQRFISDFNIHPLQMEDVINDYQRPKVEEEDSRLFIVSRMINFTKDKCIDDDQLSIFSGTNYVITFQSDYEDCLDVLRERIKAGKGTLRKRPVLYLAYALMDVVIDNYFVVLIQMSEYIEALEDCLFEQPDKKTLNQILNIRREVNKLRRIAWSERDKINEMLRDEDMIPDDEMRIYFKDTSDHIIQVIDLIDSYREMIGNLTELYLSNVSNRMNEIMKVLTIISSIFIPLSFFASLYGMNFSRENPHGGINRLNMPELYHPYGYVIVLGAMGLLVVVQLYYFWRKGWLGWNS
ncbi:MAG: magnesium transporter CorA [Adhaeribacter sp.]|jgi:magnesium transporter|nr:magnesium transporter CorA [Adhaeribacter sp.]